MNTPNKLTVLRIIMTPFFLATLMLDFPHHHLVALVLFAAASITDLIDGKIARKYNLITDFGKFLDPLADKMLTTAAFLAFIQMGIGHGITWITFIILIREFLITSLRLISAGKGKVVAANIWGKLKTVAQMSSIIFIIASRYFMWLFPNVPYAPTVIMIVTDVILWACAVLTVVSGMTYVVQNKQFIDPRK